MAMLVPAARADNLILYGRVNTALQITKIGGNPKEVTIAQQYSRFGLKGQEQTGGWTAEFKIENGFDSAGVLAYGLASRQVYIGFRNAWGSVKFGRVGTPTYDLIDSTIHDDGPSTFSVTALGIAGSRAGNAVSYQTPESEMLQLTLQASLAQTESAKHLIDGSVVYGSGQPFTAALAFRSWKEPQTHARDTYYLLSLQYCYRLFTVNSLYEYDDFNSHVWGKKDTKINKLVFSGKYTHENFAVLASAGGAGNAHAAGIQQHETGATHYTFGIHYNVSKRTRVYGFYTKLNNNFNAEYKFIEGISKGKSNQSFVAGIRHVF